MVILWSKLQFIYSYLWEYTNYIVLSDHWSRNLIIVSSNLMNQSMKYSMFSLAMSVLMLSVSICTPRLLHRPWRLLVNRGYSNIVCRVVWVISGSQVHAGLSYNLNQYKYCEKPPCPVTTCVLLWRIDRKCLVWCDLNTNSLYDFSWRPKFWLRLMRRYNIIQ